MVELTEKSWQSVYQSGEPMLVEVYSTTCVPCKMVGRVLEQIDEEPDTECGFAIGKLNSEHLTGVPELSNVTSVPTLVLVEHRTIHFLPRAFQKSQIVDKVREILEGRAQL